MTRSDQPLMLPLWSDLPNIGAGETVNERGHIACVTHPSLTALFPPPERASGRSVVICPGGGYVVLDWEEHFTRVARVLCEHGYVAFGLRYRTCAPSGGAAQAAAEDLRQSLRIIEANAQVWGVRSRQTTALGFSAGAHSILTLLTAGDNVVSSVLQGVALICPWPAQQQVGELAPAVGVPPLFVAVAEDDPVSPPVFAQDLVNAWVSAGSHGKLIRYSAGGHLAFNFGAEGSAVEWLKPLLEWISQLGENSVGDGKARCATMFDFGEDMATPARCRK